MTSVRGFEQATDSRAVGAVATADAAWRVFRQEGEYWTIAYEGQTFRLRDGKGLHYLAYLLAHPEERCPAAGLLGNGSSVGEAPGGAERARSAVTKRIKAAIKKIGEHHPALGYHLTRVIKTGRQCVYIPDPGAHEVWLL